MEWERHRERNATIKSLRQKGWSVKAIAKHVGCSQSVVHYHTSRMSVANCQRYTDTTAARLALKASGIKPTNKKYWAAERAKVVKQALERWPAVRSDPVMMGSLGLYWGEGNKTCGNIGVTNNDPLVIKACYLMLRKLHPTMAMVANIRCYDGHDLKACERFWSTLLPAAIVRAKRWTDRRSEGKWCDRCQYGSCALRCNHFETYWSIITWIDCWKEELKCDF